MKPYRALNPGTLKPQNVRAIFLTTQSEAEAPITHQTLLDSIRQYQWHLIPRNLPQSLISQTLFNLHNSPHLIHKFTSHIDFPNLSIQTQSLAAAVLASLSSPKPSSDILTQLLSTSTSIHDVFDSLNSSRLRLPPPNAVVLDLLVCACCQLNKPDEAFECFKLMTSSNVMPRTKTCNDLLTLFSKLNRTQMAWVLYADMFRLKIKSSVCTFNIMINVLCKEGKLKKAKEFLGLMEVLGIQPSVVTYNTIIHGFCMRGRVGGEQMMFGVMKGRGVKPDSYTYGLLIGGMCKERRLDEASALFEKMLEVGLVPSAVTYNMLIDGYCNKGDLERAFGYRDEMVEKG